MKKSITTFLFYIIICLPPFSSVCISQNIGVGTATPNDKAILDIYSTTKGVLLPNLNTTQRDAIKNPPNGLHIFNTDDRCLNYYDSVMKIWNCYCENCRVAQDTSIAIDVNSWDAFSFNSSSLIAPASDTYFNTSEGIKFIAQGYRKGTRLQTKIAFNFKDKNIYYKWKGSGGGQFASFVVQIKYDPYSYEGTPPVQGVEFVNGTTANTYNGSFLMQEDTWYYTSIKAIHGTNNYEVITSTGNYANKGGTIIRSSTVAVYTKSGYLAIRDNDNYAGTNSYCVLGECKISSN